MNLKSKTIANLILSIGLLTSCSAPDDTTACVSGTKTNIKHICIDKTLDKKGTLPIDIDGDGSYDFGVQLEKDVYNGATINTISYLPLVNVGIGSAGGLRFDYYAERKALYGGDSNYIPIRVYEGFDVDSSRYNWLLRLTQKEPNVVIHTYMDLEPIGSNLKYTGGLIDLGDFYIAFRYYDIQGIAGPAGWKNGWIKLSVTKDKVILKDMAYHKQPETKIKVGEK
jgi:hypothetical protein